MRFILSLLLWCCCRGMRRDQREFMTERWQLSKAIFAGGNNVGTIYAIVFLFFRHAAVLLASHVFLDYIRVVCIT